MNAPANPTDRRPWSRYLGVWLLLLLLLFAGFGAYWWFASPSGVLSGQVAAAGPGHQPVSGAQVTVVGTARTVRTDANGRFQLKLLPAGAIQVKVAAPGYDDSSLTAQMNRGAETRIDVALASSHRRSAAGQSSVALSGQVIDGDSDQPLAGVQVVVKGGNRETIATASDGRFQFAAFSENKAEIQATLPGYQAATVPWVAGAEPLTIRLSGGASLKGNVVVEAFDHPTPVPGAVVRLTGSDKTATSDREGHFSLESLVGGRSDLKVEFSAEGYATRTLSTNLADNGAALGNVALAGSATVSGSVTDRLTGKAIAGASVRVQGTRLAAQSGPGGQFTLAALPPGSHVLRISRDGYGSADKSVHVIAQGNQPIDVALVGAKSLHGAVVWDSPGGPATAIDSATVRVKESGQLVQADAQGRFSLQDLPPGPVTLVVRAPGFLQAEVACDPGADAEKTVRLRGDAALSGQAIDTAYDPPRPVPGATVRLDNSPIATRCDDKGRFLLEGVPSGPARIVVLAPGYVPCDVTQRLRGGPANPIGDIALAGNSEVQGTVTAEGNGTPVAGADVRIQGTTVAAKTDHAGHYCLSGLPPGQFEMAIDAPGYASLQHRTIIEPGTNTLKLALKKEEPAAVVVADDHSPARQVGEVPTVASGTGTGTGLAGGGAASGGGGGGSGGGGGGSKGGGGGAAPAPQPGAEARTSWLRLPEDERQKRAVFYIATGKPFSAGRVYMVSISGNILASVGLRFAPAGMAFHTKSMEDCGLAVAIPRDFGRIMRIDKTGRASTILERDPALPHPVDVGIPGGSDEIFVADDGANVLARTQIDGRPASVLGAKSSSGLNGRASLDMGMSVAATRDKHVVLATGNPAGVNRFATNASAEGEHCLSNYGGVAADIHSARWAAAQPPNQVCVYQGGQMVKQLSLPAGLVHYGKGLMSFSNDDGWLCVACVDKDNPEDGIWLCLCSNVAKAQFERLFQWKAREWTRKDMPDVTFTDKEINSFVVGPWLSWPDAILAGGTTPPRPKR